MTKLIALLAVLTAVAWGITATASWITKKKAPRALPAGKTPVRVTAVEEDKAMLGAQMRTVGGLVFAAVMFAALFRVSIGLAGHASTAIALTAGLSASGGLLLYSALPAKRLPSTQSASAQESQPVVSARMVILPAAALLAFLVFLATTALAPAFSEIHLDGVPLAVVAVLFSGATALVIHRVKTTLSLPDPRMAALDRTWRTLTARSLLHFSGGILLAGLGSLGLMTGLALPNATAQAVPYLTPACLAGGAVVAVAGVVLVVLAAKGALGMRTVARKGAAAPITA